MRKFIEKNRKLLSVFGIILAAVIITVTTIGVVNDVTASVFKGQDDKKKEVIKKGREALILEIVPEYGQQILGYTIPGYEPITKEAIEAYPLDGPADLSDAKFKEATGWSVTKTSSGYVVNENDLPLKDAFSKNVFGEALKDTDVKLVVKQANDVTTADIRDCDLIYITNPRENSNNLLYYYDQVMNYDAETHTFSDRVAMGDAGAYYDSINYEPIASSELAVRLIKNATGRSTALTLNDTMAQYYDKANITNTKSIFEVAGLKNYRKCNEEDYLKALESCEKGSLSDADAIDKFLENQNLLIENDAINEIKESAGNSVFIENMTDADKKEAFRQTMIRANLVDSATGQSLFLDVNFDLYVNHIASTAQGGFSLGRSSINTAIKYLNSVESNTAREEIRAMSLKSLEEIQETVTKELFEKANLDIYREYNFDAYLNALTVTPIENQVGVLELVEAVNAAQKEKARLSIAEAVGKHDAVEALTTEMFEKADIEEFDIDYLEFYKEELIKVEADSIVSEEQKLPEYTDDPESSIIVHVSNGEELASPKLSASIEITGNDTPIELAQVDLVFEEGSNKYYRAVLNLTEEQAAAIEGAETTLKLNLKIQLDEATEKTLSVSTVYGEYWCAFNSERPDGMVFNSNEVLVADTIFGESFKYGDFMVNVIDNDKLVDIFAKANVTYAKLDAEISYDFSSWDTSKELYDYVVNNKSGLIFSSGIVSEIGELTYDDANIRDGSSSAGSDNNLYKSLLLISLRTVDLVSDTIFTKIDSEGVYCPVLSNPENSYSKWKISTFAGKNSIKVYYINGKVFRYGRNIEFNGNDFQSRNNYAQNCQSYVSGFVNQLNDITGSEVTLGDIIRNMMDMYINQLQNYPLKVLEIQPVAPRGVLNSHPSDTRTGSADVGYNGAVKLAKWLRIDYSDMTKSNYKEYFDVTTMSVREFNTQNKVLTAEYDLIYIGKDSGSLKSKKFDDGVIRTYFKDTNLRGYVYTAIGDKITGGSMFRGLLKEDYITTSVKHGSDKHYSSGNLTYYQKKDYEVWKKYFTKAYDFDFSGDEYVVKNSNCTVRAGATDITVKKYNELMEYLKAGYPILMEDEILYCDTDQYIQYDGVESSHKKWRYVDPNSKMYHFVHDAKKLGYDDNLKKYTGKDKNGNEVFADGYKYANLVSVSSARTGGDPENLSDADKFKGGLSFATKRNAQVEFQYISGPTEYNSSVNSKGVGTTIKYKTPEYYKYQIVLGVPEYADIEWVEENYEFLMYIDKSGSGKFSKKMYLGPSVDFNYKSNYVVIEGNWPLNEDGTVDGFLPWRVEARRKDNPNNHYIHTGFSAFEKIDKSGTAFKKDIEVLWVAAENNKNLNFETIITDDIPEYNIIVTKVGYYAFNNGGYWPNTDNNITYNSSNSVLKVGKFNTSATGDRAKKEFDMIVFGFCDSYNGLDIQNINALKNIDYFVASGHSLFFSHDNAGQNWSVNNYYKSGWNSLSELSNGYGKYSTSFLKGMLGFDMYGLLYSKDAFVYGYDSEGNPVSEDEADENTKLNPNYQKAAADARKYIDSSDMENFRTSCEGHLFRYTGGSQFFTDRGTGGTGIGAGNLYTTKKIRFVNQGQVSMYPYVLGDSIDIANTHYQYESLNLEDEDTLVWATLEFSGAANNVTKDIYGVTSGDGSNQYYIYTKGNVTYTGAGHSGIGSNGDESKLFINTVIAAIKARNCAPEISFENESDKNSDDESIICAYDTDRYVTIEFKVTDYDKGAGVKNAFSSLDFYFEKIGGASTAEKYNPEDGDILINGSESFMMDEDGKEYKVRDENGNVYDKFDKDNVSNGKSLLFTLSYVDIANKYNQIHNIDETYKYIDGKYYKNGIEGAFATEIKDVTEKFFDEYLISISARDFAEVTSGTSTEIEEGILGVGKARVSFRTLFNLN